MIKKYTLWRPRKPRIEEVSPVDTTCDAKSGISYDSPYGRYLNLDMCGSRPLAARIFNQVGITLSEANMYDTCEQIAAWTYSNRVVTAREIMAIIRFNLLHTGGRIGHARTEAHIRIEDEVRRRYRIDTRR